MSMINTGYLEYEELKELQTLPDEERFAKGPVAVIECVQEIPCNPCEMACKFGAIQIGEPITNLPHLISEKCVGCGVCVSRCSGMAIFVVNKVYSDTTATVSFPYEYYPLPKKGDVTDAVNRKGETVCKGTIINVVNPASYDHTPVITVEIPKEYADEVRSIARKAGTQL
ncbi:MAG: 4Fe-4S binding protein [Lachnospira sp.]|nr:4Fe-4S binding protein [Lachnospira sp.]